MSTSLDWCAPDACTLPAADQPARVAEWDHLFRTSVRAVSHRRGVLRLALDRSVTDPSLVADLADREARCCAFLVFELRITSTDLALAVSGDPEHASVVAALASRAGALSGRRPVED